MTKIRKIKRTEDCEHQNPVKNLWRERERERDSLSLSLPLSLYRKLRDLLDCREKVDKSDANVKFNSK